jgi:predicted GIY-YIG superfamily endonuclease
MERLAVAGKTAVYRIFYAGEIIYVGKSARPKARFGAHKRVSRVPRTSTLEIVEWFDDPKAALVEEKRLIVVHRPTLNLIHNHAYSEFKAAKIAARDKLTGQEVDEVMRQYAAHTAYLASLQKPE